MGVQSVRKDGEWLPVIGATPQTTPVSGDQIINVMDYGATGDGSTDDTSAIQSALDAAANGSIVFFPEGEYFITAELVAPPGVVITGVGVRSVIKFTFNSNALRIRSDSVVERLKFIGSYIGDDTLPSQRAICANPDADDGTEWVSNVTIQNVVMEDVGVHGIRLRFVKGFTIDSVEVHRWGQAGVFASNCSGGVITASRLYGDMTRPFSATYGIIASASNTPYDSIANPNSRWIDINGCSVEDVGWVGINTHGGRGIRIRGNTILRCYTGISAVTISGTNPTPHEALIVSDNTIDGESLTTRRYGIYAGGDGTPSETIITGNRVRRHGSTDEAINGAIRVYNAPMALIANNIVRECLGNGIAAVDSHGTTINSNIVIDVFSISGVATPAAIYLDNDGDSKVVWYQLVGNTIRRGNLDRINVNARGIETPNRASIRMTQYGNDWSEAALPYDAFPVSETMIGHTDNSSTRVGFYGATPITRRSISGSRGGNTALTNLLNALHEIGIINNNTS